MSVSCLVTVFQSKNYVGESHTTISVDVNAKNQTPDKPGVALNIDIRDGLSLTPAISKAVLNTIRPILNCFGQKS